MKRRIEEEEEICRIFVYCILNHKIFLIVLIVEKVFNFHDEE